MTGFIDPNQQPIADDRRYAVRINDEITIDVMPSIGGHGWAEMRPHIVERVIDGVRIRLLDPEGSLKTRQGLRPKDRMDARVIRAVRDAISKSS